MMNDSTQPPDKQEPIERDYQPTLHPSKENWAAAQHEITALEKERRRRLDAQAPVQRWVTVFDEEVEDNETLDLAKARRVQERLTAAGIPWKERYTSRDCEWTWGPGQGHLSPSRRRFGSHADHGANGARDDHPFHQVLVGAAIVWQHYRH